VYIYIDIHTSLWQDSMQDTARHTRTHTHTECTLCRFRTLCSIQRLHTFLCSSYIYMYVYIYVQHLSIHVSIYLSIYLSIYSTAFNIYIHFSGLPGVNSCKFLQGFNTFLTVESVLVQCEGAPVVDGLIRSSSDVSICNFVLVKQAK
jgi:hypothetical protein